MTETFIGLFLLTFVWGCYMAHRLHDSQRNLIELEKRIKAAFLALEGKDECIK